jgi:CBS-domain-containing membrane protein
LIISINEKYGKLLAVQYAPYNSINTIPHSKIPQVNNMNASEVMNPNPITLKATDTIECASEYIMKHRYRSLPVVDENFCYLGMFGVNCLLKQVIPSSALMDQGLENVSFIHESIDDLYQRFNEVKQQPISVCMSQEITPVSPDTPLTETLLQLYETRFAIPVVEKGSCKLLGMISYWDVGKKILGAGDQSDA